MRILILVLSYNQPPYDALMKAQQETWARQRLARNNPISYCYYGGGRENKLKLNDNGNIDIELDCPDDYYMMHWKFKLALDQIHGSQIDDYDFIFRTNSSSYINKRALLEFAETLPKEKLYGGWDLGPKKAISGAGIWLSADMVDILRQEIPAGEQIEEDLLIGRILVDKYGIETTDDKSRFDVPDQFSETDIPKNAYHFRFKTPDRQRDVENMYKVHKILNG